MRENKRGSFFFFFHTQIVCPAAKHPTVQSRATSAHPRFIISLFATRRALFSAANRKRKQAAFTRYGQYVYTRCTVARDMSGCERGGNGEGESVAARLWALVACRIPPNEILPPPLAGHHPLLPDVSLAWRGESQHFRARCWPEHTAFHYVAKEWKIPPRKIHREQ